MFEYITYLVALEEGLRESAFILLPTRYNTGLLFLHRYSNSRTQSQLRAPRILGMVEFDTDFEHDSTPFTSVGLSSVFSRGTINVRYDSVLKERDLRNLLRP